MSSTQVSKPTGPLEIVEKDIPELGERQGYGTRKSSISKKSKAIAARAEVTLAITFIVSAFIVSALPSSLLSIHYQIPKAMAQIEDNRESAWLSTTQNYHTSNSNITTSTNSSSANIPAAAIGPTIPPKGYLVQEIRDGLYWLTDGAYQTMFMVTDKGVVAVDAPPSIGKNYLKAIAEVTSKPVTYVIYSHAHLDHIGAAAIFPKNATYIAQDEVAASLQEAKASAANASMVPPIPTVTFSKNYTLNVGGQTLQLDYYGVNHSPGNIFIYAPKQMALMLVDVIWPGWVPFPYLGLAQDVAGFIKAHDIALNNYNFDTFIGGHLTRIGTRNDVVVAREFVSDLEKAAAQANKQVPFPEIAKQVGQAAKAFLSTNTYTDALDQRCTQIMLPKWENRLGGAQQFMSSHCYTMAEALRIDPTMALTQNSTS
jgi:glyoxylase-like metal-dependent hydrolase (beta-lactamase superfamily II)